MSKDKKDILFFFTSKVITGILGLLIITIYSKELSTAEYGNYSLIAGLVTALISIFIGWIGSSVLRYYIEYKDNKKEFYTNIWIYTTTMIILILLITIGVGTFSQKIPILKYLLPTIYFTISYSLTDVFEKVLRASEKTTVYAVSLILQSLSSVALFLVLKNTFSDGAVNILFSTASSRIIFSIIAIVFLGFTVNLKNLRINKEMLKRFLNFGIPMIGVWGVSWILNYCDRYIIATFFNSSEVGVYDMSYRLSESSINVLISSFTLAIYPILIRVWKNQGKEEVEKKLKETIKYYLLLILPAVVGLALVVDKLYIGFLDEKYLPGKNVIIIVSLGMLFNGLTSIFNKIWQLTEKTKMIFRVMLVSVIINIGLNIIFIPRIGIDAAAYTTMGSYIISFIITYVLARKEISINFDFNGIIKTIISTILMGAFIVLGNNYVHNMYALALEIIAAVAIYVVANVIMGNINIKEFRKGS